MNFNATLYLDSHSTPANQAIKRTQKQENNRQTISLSVLVYSNAFVFKFFVTLYLGLIANISSVHADIFAKSTEQLNKGTTFTVPEIKPEEAFPGGETTVSVFPFPSSFLAANNLAESKRALFHAGKALAHQPWIKAPTTTDARDGLGPIYNARTCLACHVNGGRGRMPEDENAVLFNAVVRVSIPDLKARYKMSAEPHYGTQLQTQSVSLAHQLRAHVSENQLKQKEVAPEAYIHVRWQEKTVSYVDGELLSLRSPTLVFSKLNYGKFQPNTRFSLRNAPPLHGMGLLEHIAQKDIDALADEDDTDNNGISGRVNYIWDTESQKEIPGRFGLKANEGNVRLQTAAAFVNDLGITNPVFPQQPCTQSQQLCQNSAHGDDPKIGVELSEALLTLTANFVRNIGVPKRRNESDETVLRGRSLFYKNGCQQCHTPSFVTKKSEEFPHLSEQTIWPYSDLLLHDMGAGLADDRPDYLATGKEWRTPTLWGIGLSKAINGSHHFLHDGRARSTEEAIVWHGGEAEKSKQSFMALNKEQRRALIKFVESL